MKLSVIIVVLFLTSLIVDYLHSFFAIFVTLYSIFVCSVVLIYIYIFIYFLLFVFAYNIRDYLNNYKLMGHF